MSKVFVSYRREDAQGEAGHLLADLHRRLGEAQVFMDIATISAGEDFGLAIERAMADCSVVLVVIGKSWLDMRDARGARRLDDPSDWVRLEVESALNGDRKVIPVLVQGSSMPSESLLPASIAALARRNAHEMSARRWDYDFDALAKTLMKLLGVTSVTSSEAGTARKLLARRMPQPRWLRVSPWQLSLVSLLYEARRLRHPPLPPSSVLATLSARHFRHPPLPPSSVLATLSARHFRHPPLPPRLATLSARRLRHPPLPPSSVFATLSARRLRHPPLPPSSVFATLSARRLRHPPLPPSSVFATLSARRVEAKTLCLIWDGSTTRLSFECSLV